VALPFYIKKDLKAKEEELWKFKNISPCKIIYNLPKKSFQGKRRIMEI
jgi:ABC-type uncharacterized transport system YnjBCD substrate-binding protein